MNLNNLYSIAQCKIVMGFFSNLLSIAVAADKSILKIQTIDTFEKWGVESKYHEYCYGRHLYYQTKTGISIPFWIGLDITKNNLAVSITFERNLLNILFPKNQVVTMVGVHSIIPKHCNVKRNFFIVRQLITSDFNKLCKNHNPQILIDFLNEVFSFL